MGLIATSALILASKPVRHVWTKMNNKAIFSRTPTPHTPLTVIMIPVIVRRSAMQRNPERAQHLERLMIYMNALTHSQPTLKELVVERTGTSRPTTSSPNGGQAMGL